MFKPFVLRYPMVDEGEERKIRDQEHKDNIRVAVFNKQLDLMWKQAQHVSTVEAGSLVAWYVLKENPALATLILMFAIILIGIMLCIMKRYAILVNRYNNRLKHIIGRSSDDQENNIKFFNRRMTAHILLRLIPAFLIFVNALLIITTWLEYCNIVLWDIPHLIASIFGLAIICIVLFISYILNKYDKKCRWLPGIVFDPK